MNSETQTENKPKEEWIPISACVICGRRNLLRGNRNCCVQTCYHFRQEVVLKKTGDLIPFKLKPGKK